ncbi:hypothetical protein PWR63_22525 [Paraburkholderia sp. A2WS-5]|uniref:T6SS effector phospholipase Tle3 domain-containing protein n=1 Tax=unclassified Paraburkholderia TaxID=2615204 RepID=UPI003B78477E
MTDSFPNPDTASSIPPAAPATEPPRIVIGQGQGPLVFDLTSELICVKQQPLPGVVIFVHGVNSEGEWFEPAEAGLCKGLNRRLARLDDQMAYRGVVGGQMCPAHYTESLTPDGFLNPDLWAGNYIKPDASFSPVIHFRWGYKANKDELKEYGDKIFLNEQGYWGGGPFANGCSSLPDLWQEGIDDRIFGFITVQGLNPTQRPLYRTPPRAYGVLAALRLAKLIQSIRQTQANVPITIVCHSQGNMVGLTAAFFGDQLPEVTDPWGNVGRCVADAYVLANPPYSVSNTGTVMENWSQRKIRDAGDNRGRETYEARTKTLREFFNIIRARRAFEMPVDKVDEDMANERISPTSGKRYKAAEDRAAHGVNNSTYGRVTLYCCPHDQVISATTVQGIGWRGLAGRELADTGAQGVLTQRVFATHFPVGLYSLKNTPLEYRYWEDDWRHGKGKTSGFWYPPSPPAKYGLTDAWSGNENPVGWFATTMTAPLLSIVTLVTSSLDAMRVNADPPTGWKVVADAPRLDEPFTPKALRYGKECEIEDGPNAHSDFNESHDPPAAARDAAKTDAKPDDPYDNYEKGAKAIGDKGSEAAQRYEDHAILRMRALRQRNPDWIDGNGNVIGEDGKSTAPEGYTQWRNAQVVSILNKGANNNPTNHSTIMTNPMHAEKALAYDVAIGLCYLSPEQMKALRLEADWRLGIGMGDDNPNKKYSKYFENGLLGGVSLDIWAKTDDEAKMPAKIADEREGSFYLNIGGVA